MFRLFLQKLGASLDNACSALRQGFLPTTNMFQWWHVTFTSYSSSVKGHESSPCYTGVCFEQNMGIFKLSSVTKIENNLAPVKQAVTDHIS